MKSASCFWLGWAINYPSVSLGSSSSLPSEVMRHYAVVHCVTEGHHPSSGRCKFLVRRDLRQARSVREWCEAENIASTKEPRRV
jgi:hypothetical protein